MTLDELVAGLQKPAIKEFLETSDDPTLEKLTNPKKVKAQFKKLDSGKDASISRAEWNFFIDKVTSSVSLLDEQEDVSSSRISAIRRDMENKPPPLGVFLFFFPFSLLLFLLFFFDAGDFDARHATRGCRGPRALAQDQGAARRPLLLGQGPNGGRQVLQPVRRRRLVRRAAARLARRPLVRAALPRQVLPRGSRRAAVARPAAAEKRRLALLRATRGRSNNRRRQTTTDALPPSVLSAAAQQMPRGGRAGTSRATRTRSCRSASPTPTILSASSSASRWRVVRVARC